MRRRTQTFRVDEHPTMPAVLAVEGPSPDIRDFRRVCVSPATRETDYISHRQLVESPTGALYLREATFLGWRVRPVVTE